MGEWLAAIFRHWASFFGEHPAVSIGVAFVHVAGLLWGGGRAVTADLLTLRSGGRAEFLAAGHLRFLAASHRDVLRGLALTAGTGLLLFAADAQHYLETWTYWAKMAGVGLLLVNGLFLRRLEGPLEGEGGEAAWPAARRHAGLSVVFWFVTVLLGLIVAES
jgi:hypothetical protein